MQIRERQKTIVETLLKDFIFEKYKNEKFTYCEDIALFDERYSKKHRKLNETGNFYFNYANIDELRENNINPVRIAEASFIDKDGSYCEIVLSAYENSENLLASVGLCPFDKHHVIKFPTELYPRRIKENEENSKTKNKPKFFAKYNFKPKFLSNAKFRKYKFLIYLLLLYISWILWFIDKGKLS